MPTSFPLLSLMLLLPLVGAALCAFCAQELARRLALLVAVLELVLSVVALCRFDAALPGFQLFERHAWIGSLNLEFLLGVDGISILFLPLTALLTVAVLIHAWSAWPGQQGSFAALLLVLQAATLGIFVALDTVLFFLFWELTLPPLFFLISRFGAGPERRIAALKYTLYMLFGGAPLLFAFILLALNHAEVNGLEVPAGLSFSLPQLLETEVPLTVQRAVFFLLLAGFGVKAPLFPLHTWLPKVAFEGPAQITAWLLGLKLGVYGLVRFLLPLAPDAVQQFQRPLALLGALTLIYAAMVALRQSNLRGLLAYAGISHVGLVVMGLASLTEQGIQGALFQLFNFTLIAAALMLLAASVQQRVGSTELVHLGGLAAPLPRCATLLVFFALASLGAPPTSGFPAELLLLIGNFKAHAGLGLAALTGAILGAAALLQFLRRALWGPLNDPRHRHLVDLLPREYLLLLGFAMLVLLLGIFPSLILDLTAPVAAALLRG
jgi:NADH-quinone oxidoreductase subunit M